MKQLHPNGTQRRSQNNTIQTQPFPLPDSRSCGWWLAALAWLWLSWLSALAADITVSSVSQISSALGSLRPGDSLVMTTGTWANADILFRGNGTPASPITLRAQVPGQVFLTGTSRLRIAGSHLVVDGLVFRQGSVPSGDVIAFRESSSALANNCRVKNCAIINYNPGSTSADTKWVSLYGYSNRVDHCYFAGKNNSGALLVVWLNGLPADKPNYHRIDHNYIGERPDLGQNGGEGMRIGDSSTSFNISRTTVEANYFHDCSGEVEIISNKSCENSYSGNTFEDCAGALTLRHGNRCTVEGNFFFGNNKSGSGGVRIIGEDHKVYNNYFADLTGSGPRSALSIMKGLVDTPLNGYFQVKRAVVAFNTFVNCQTSMLIGHSDTCSGCSQETTLPMEDCIIANNIILSPGNALITQAITPVNMLWEGNIMFGGSLGIPANGGIRVVDPQLVADSSGVWRPTPTSPAIGSAQGSYPYVTLDIDGQTRPTSKDAGCDQRSTATPTQTPLTATAVGPLWMNPQQDPDDPPPPPNPGTDTTAPAAVSSLGVDGVTGNSATLAWTAPGDDGNTGVAASYDVRYSTSTITEANWNSATQASGEPTPGYAGAEHSSTINGLSSGTRYYFALKTTDDAGNVSPLSNVPNALTSSTSGNPPPGNYITSPSVTRGPYLQQATPSSVIVRWRTATATASHVRYGTDPGNLTSVASDPASVTEHILNVRNLQPDTKYYYEIGTASGWYRGTNNFFVTHPLAGTPRPTRIWALGDSGTADARAVSVRDAFTRYTGARNADVWLMLGDNAYDSGTDEEHQAAVFDMYPTYLRNTPLWPTIGNHETPEDYVQIFSLPQNGEAGGVSSGTEHYYSFDYGNIHFVCLDSSDSDNSPSGPMCNWLRADLDATTQEWIIAYWHHPPYSKGTHDSDSEDDLYLMRQNVVPILESYGVDLVLCGHSHNYERSFLLDGHYGNSSTLTQAMKKDGGDGREDGTGAYRKAGGLVGRQGAVYTVAGSSGKATADSESLDHPAMYISMNELGSLVIDVNGNRLDLVFLRETGVAADHFTMIKGTTSTTPPAAPSGLSATAVSISQINLAWADNSNDEIGFKIERSTNGVDFVQIAVVGASVINGADIGLAPATTYYYRVRAHNSAGHSPYSNRAQATTQSGPPPGDTTPPAAVANLTVSAVTSNSATLLWTAPGDDGNSGTAAVYDVRYSTSPITTANWGSATQASGEPTPAAAGNSQSFTIRGLAPSTTYYFALRTADEANNISPLSNVANATTAAPPPSDTTPPAAITDLQIVDVTSNSVRLSWTATGDDGNSGTGNRYDLRHSTSPITDANWGSAAQANGEPSPASAGTAQNFTVNGLAAGRTYYFALRTMDESSNASPISNVPSSMTTPAGPPDDIAPAAITTLMVSAMSSNNVTLSWIASGDDGNVGTATRYEVRYSTSAINDANWNSTSAIATPPPPTAAGTVQSVTASGLTPGATYYFAIKAFDDADNASALSNVPTGVPALNLFAGTALVPSNSVWRFLDDGSDQGSSWSAMGFNDSVWRSGPARLGYGIGGEATLVSYGASSSAKHITTYFRRTFNVSDPAQYSNLLIQLVRDDGAIVCLNGVEVYRSNMPEGGVTSQTRAASDVTGSGSQKWYPRNVSPALLVAGENVVAVEIHQDAPSTPDLSFNLQLSAATTGNPPPPPPGDTTPPAAVINLAAIATSATSASISWTAPGDDGNVGTAASYDLRRSTSPITEANWSSATQVSGEPAPAIAGTTQSMTASGLASGATHYFALRTRDAAGNLSPLSNVASAATPQAPDTTPPGAISNLRITGITVTSATLAWVASGDDGSSGRASAYDLRYSTAPITEANWASVAQINGEPTPASSGSSQNMTVSGLAAATTYYFAMKSTDDAGNVSPLSDVATGTTSVAPDTTPPGAVLDLAALAENATTAIVLWTAPGDDGNSGTAASYDLRRSMSPITEGNWGSATQVSGEPNPGVAGAPQSMTVSGLAPGAAHYFALRTRDEAGNASPLSTLASATTPEGPDMLPPNAVNGLTASLLNPSTARLLWMAPGDDASSGIAALYDIRYSTSPITDDNWHSALQATGEPAPASAGMLQEFIVSGLEPERTYYFALKTVDEIGNISPLSNVPSVSTRLIPEALTLVAGNAVWKYEDDGSDQRTGWRTRTFEDSEWLSGVAPLGTTDSAATEIRKRGLTTYFRHSFTVADPSVFRSLELDLMADDGAVVYLNGVEVFRVNMPSGSITYTTKAVEPIGDTAPFVTATIGATGLLPGINVVAVEVHQAKKKGSHTDISFALQLTGHTTN